MSTQIQLGLDLGDGLHTTDNKLAVHYEPNGNMDLESENSDDTLNGIYVNNLNGADGQGGGSRYDGWSVKPGKGWNINDGSQTINDFIDMDRDVVNLIFTFGLYKPSMRHPSSITYGSDPKDVRSICNEIVAPVNFNSMSRTSYKPGPGELIQLVTNPTFRTVPFGSSTIACETLNRVTTQVQETKVMFVINEIHYMSDITQGGNEYWVHDMALCCIYSSIPNFVVGTTYTGTQGFDSSHI